MPTFWVKYLCDCNAWVWKCPYERKKKMQTPRRKWFYACDLIAFPTNHRQHCALKEWNEEAREIVDERKTGGETENKNNVMEMYLCVRTCVCNIGLSPWLSLRSIYLAYRIYFQINLKDLHNLYHRP